MNIQRGNKGIEWCDATWNPITGCLHDCWYCYAQKIALRFQGHYQPTIHYDRLKEKMPKKSSKIFVGSMADMFGDWVDPVWIKWVLEIVKKNPQHTFQFLTKNPKRYSEFEFPKNCWLGLTLDKPSGRKLFILKQQPNYTFISFEPLCDDMSDINLKGIDWVIIGAMTGMGKRNIIPKKEWIEYLIKEAEKYNIPVFIKDNVKWSKKIQKFPE